MGTILHMCVIEGTRVTPNPVIQVPQIGLLEFRTSEANWSSTFPISSLPISDVSGQNLPILLELICQQYCCPKTIIREKEGKKKKHTHKHTQSNFFKIHIQNNDKSSEKKADQLMPNVVGEGGRNKKHETIQSKIALDEMSSYHQLQRQQANC